MGDWIEQVLTLPHDELQYLFSVAAISIAIALMFKFFSRKAPKKILNSNSVSGASQPVVTQKDIDALCKTRYSPPSNRRPRVYVDGVFDCFHFGHALALKQAKLTVPNCELVVGVTDDETTHKLKGMTVMTAKERAECVRHCKYADEVIENCPWYVSIEFMDKNNLDYIAHGDDIQIYNGVDIYAFAKEVGRFKIFPRTPAISTSDLILRIIKEYDVYLKRNLDRGYSRKDLNISWGKEKEIELKGKIEHFGEFLLKFGKDHVVDPEKFC